MLTRQLTQIPKQYFMNGFRGNILSPHKKSKLNKIRLRSLRREIIFFNFKSKQYLLIYFAILIHDIWNIRTNCYENQNAKNFFVTLKTLNFQTNRYINRCDPLPPGTSWPCWIMIQVLLMFTGWNLMCVQWQTLSSVVINVLNVLHNNHDIQQKHELQSDITKSMGLSTYNAINHQHSAIKHWNTTTTMYYWLKLSICMSTWHWQTTLEIIGLGLRIGITNAIKYC